MPATPCDNDDDPHAPGTRLAWWTALAVAASAASAVTVRLAYVHWHQHLVEEARRNLPARMLGRSEYWRVYADVMDDLGGVGADGGPPTD